VKSDIRLPLTFGFILLLLLAHRLLVKLYPPDVADHATGMFPPATSPRK
jgi:hypothetical protein